MTVNCFDARTVPEARRSLFWHDVVKDVLQLESRSEALECTAFETVLQVHRLDNLLVGLVRGNAHEVCLDGRPQHRMAHVIFPSTPGGFVETDGLRHALASGSGYLVNTARPTLIRTPRRFEHLSIGVPMSSLERTAPLLARAERGPLVLNGIVATTLEMTLRSLFVTGARLSAEAAPAIALAIIELLNAALIESLGHLASTAQGVDTQHKKRIRDYALARLSDPSLCIESIGAAVSLSPRRIHQLFAEGGMTLSRWIWSERLSRAHNQLATGARTQLRIGDVAYQWGFNDPAHFSRAFRQHYGVSPSQLLASSGGRSSAAAAALTPLEQVDGRIGPTTAQGLAVSISTSRSRVPGATSLT